jgi:archaellum biogenesis ATPase FlaH
MTDQVVSLRPEAELSEFFQSIWGDQQGYAYVPVKEAASEKWDTHFFQWPLQKQQVIKHVLEYTPYAEVYFGPALYIQPTQPVPENIKGTSVLWTEFDGNAPKGGVLGDKIPHPTLRVQSSQDGHEHFYWHLDYFETNRERIEDINRSIAYTLQADSSGWDSTQILRPPSTKNHKRNRVVRILSSSNSKYSEEFFTSLNIPKQLTKEEIVLDEVPEIISVIAKYKWDSEEFLFFRKNEMATGTRSSALMRLAYICAELRMSDEEAYAILRNADDRWGKFKGRRDQDKRLLDLVNRARHKYPINPETEVDGLPVFNWQELEDLEVHVDWLIEGILQRQGIMVVAGKQGVGKTQLTIQALIHMALGKPFLGWKIDSPRRVALMSMEMSSAEVKHFQKEMNHILSPEDKRLLQENFFIIPVGHSILFDDSADKKKIEQFIQQYHPEVIAVDSLSKTTMGSLEESAVKNVLDFADHLRMDYDCSLIFIHHNRKGQVGNKRPKELDDVYGTFWITATATTVIGMWQNQQTGEIEINYLKVRLAEAPKTQVVVRTPRGLSFEEVTASTLVKAAMEAGENGKESERKESGPPTPGQDFTRF